jgi:hypothetical protein
MTTEAVGGVNGDTGLHWMDRVLADRLPALHSLITGLRRGLAAVVAGLTLTWSSGPVEGTVEGLERTVPDQGVAPNDGCNDHRDRC